MVWYMDNSRNKILSEWLEKYANLFYVQRGVYYISKGNDLYQFTTDVNDAYQCYDDDGVDLFVNRVLKIGISINSYPKILSLEYTSIKIK